jgi:hypothetical protein
MANRKGLSSGKRPWQISIGLGLSRTSRNWLKPASFYVVALRIFSRDYFGTRVETRERFQPRHGERRREPSSRAVSGESERERASQMLPDQPPPVVATEQREESFPLKSYTIIKQIGFSTRELGTNGFQDAQSASRRQNALQAQASASKELLELIPRSLAASRHHEHVDIEQLTPVRIITRRYNRVDDQYFSLPL